MRKQSVEQISKSLDNVYSRVSKKNMTLQSFLSVGSIASLFALSHIDNQYIPFLQPVFAYIAGTSVASLYNELRNKKLFNRGIIPNSLTNKRYYNELKKTLLRYVDKSSTDKERNLRSIMASIYMALNNSIDIHDDIYAESDIPLMSAIKFIFNVKFQKKIIDGNRHSFYQSHNLIDPIVFSNSADNSHSNKLCISHSTFSFFNDNLLKDENGEFSALIKSLNNDFTNNGNTISFLMTSMLIDNVIMHKPYAIIQKQGNEEINEHNKSDQNKDSNESKVVSIGNSTENKDEEIYSSFKISRPHELDSSFIYFVSLLQNYVFSDADVATMKSIPIEDISISNPIVFSPYEIKNIITNNKPEHISTIIQFLKDFEIKISLHNRFAERQETNEIIDQIYLEHTLKKDINLVPLTHKMHKVKL